MMKLLAANWKMHGSLRANSELVAALSAVGGVESVLCVPFPYLAQLERRPSGIALGAQDVSEYASGAYTGEVSAAMLAEFGCAYVIVGHSERRTLFGDSDARVGLKAEAALQAGLVPIVCVGETLAERERGEVMDVIGRQLAAVEAVLGAELVRVVLAYEPVWAIGTGLAATAAQVGEVHGAIRAWLGERLRGVPGAHARQVRILYGGSVKPDNAAELFAIADVDGGLIGGASLVAEEFMAICRAAAS